MTTSDVRAVIANVQLVDVRLMDAGARTTVRDAGAVPNASLFTRHGSRVIQREEDGFIIRAFLEAKVYSEAKEQTPENAPIRLGVAFALTYALPDARAFSDEGLEEFARVNGTFNAWPYFREYLQSMSSRMGLPPILLPVLKMKGPDAGPNSDDAVTKPAPQKDGVVTARRRRPGAPKKGR